MEGEGLENVSLNPPVARHLPLEPRTRGPPRAHGGPGPRWGAAARDGVARSPSAPAPGLAERAGSELL